VNNDVYRKAGSVFAEHVCAIRLTCVLIFSHRHCMNSVECGMCTSPRMINRLLHRRTCYKHVCMYVS